MPDLVYPNDPRFQSTRNQFIGRPAEVLPRAVVRCWDAFDVVDALDHVTRQGCEFAIRGGGHSNAGHSSSPDVVLDLSPDDSISVRGRRVTVGAGVRVGQLAEYLAPLSLLVPAGSCPSVGLVGTALGGGFGAHGRLHGLTCDRMVSAEIVLADRRAVTVSETCEPELFWALRGAGAGNFGVVTRATFDMVPSTPRTHFRFGWSWHLADILLPLWQEWAPYAPDSTSAELVLACPDQLTEPPQVLLTGAGDATGFLDEVPAPALADVRPLSSAEAAVLHATPASAAARDPVGIPLRTHRPGMSSSKTEFFDHVIPTDALLAHFAHARVHGETREVTFTPWRGAYAHEQNTAFAHRSPAFLVRHTVLVGSNDTTRRGEQALAWLAGSWAALHPHGTGRVYGNFPDPDLPDWAHAYYGSNVDRLRNVKAKYDPKNLFRFAQSLSA